MKSLRTGLLFSALFKRMEMMNLKENSLRVKPRKLFVVESFLTPRSNFVMHRKGFRDGTH
jgi:hypothetical protein